MADKRELGPGERALKATVRTRNRMLVICLLLGAILGGVMGLADRNSEKGLLSFQHMALDPVVAVVLAIGFVIGLVGLPIYMFGKVDELKVLRNMQAMTAGWFAVMGGYPAWQSLAAGGLASQPSAIGVFLLGYGFTLATFVVLKLRD